MNLVQLIRKSRLGVDAIMPSGAVSSMWSDDEMVDLTNEAYEEIWQRFRLMRKKWGLVTLKQADAAFSMDGEAYDPGPNLTIGNNPSVTFNGPTTGTADTPCKVWLPPDFGEMVRVLCTSNRTVRFLPAQMESFHWVDMEQGSFNTSGGGVLPSTPDGLTFYWDIIQNRTMVVIPPVTQSFKVSIDYIPMKRPMYYTSTGTVSCAGGTPVVTGTLTTFLTSQIYSEASNQAAELMTGFTLIQDTGIKLGIDYTRVVSIQNDTQLTLIAPSGSFSGANFILTMAPALPREYHRWIARLTSALMLSKVSPDMSDKAATSVYQRFTESVQPAARSRQSQESTVTEDAEEFGVTTEW